MFAFLLVVLLIVLLIVLSFAAQSFEVKKNPGQATHLRSVLHVVVGTLYRYFYALHVIAACGVKTRCRDFLHTKLHFACFVCLCYVNPLLD